MLSLILTLIVAAIHFYFLYLEMVKWEAPRTRKIFGTTAEFAAQSRVLAANQGLYNGFLAVGLIVALIIGNVPMSVYLLACVALAGLYAAYCGIKPALIFQTIPALLALVTVWTGL
ncbi:MAG: putative membrane protein [Yoonia sp.]|jgi:putative membrane protein